MSQELWRAVLDQAYVDAESACKRPERKTQAAVSAWQQAVMDRKRARLYLMALSKEDEIGLREVCDMADVNANAVINWARNRYRGAIQPSRQVA